MPTELIIAGALANCGREAPTDEFLETLAWETPGLAVFLFRPKPRPGMGVKAALDWQAILGTAADLLAFASVIWAAYERYVKPKRDQSAETQKPLLLISLRRPDGSSTHFALGNEYTEKEVFIEHFTQQVSVLRESTNTEPEHSVLSEITKNKEQRLGTHQCARQNRFLTLRSRGTR